MPNFTDGQFQLVWTHFQYLYNALLAEQTLIEGRVSYYPELRLYGDGEGRVVIGEAESPFNSVPQAIEVIARRRQESEKRVAEWRADQWRAAGDMLEHIEQHTSASERYN